MFPRPKRIEDFDFAANPDVPAALIATLARSAWVAAGQPCCLIGDSGTGKSHLLIALGTEAAMAGYRVRYVLAAKLVNELVEAAAFGMDAESVMIYLADRIDPGRLPATMA